MIELFKTALEQPGWINDKVEDQFPRARSKNASGVRLSQMGKGTNQDNNNQGKKRGLSKSLGVDLEELPAKRQRADEVEGGMFEE